MKYASMLSAKVLLVLFLASGTTSYLYGKRIYDDLPNLDHSLQSEQKKLRNAQQDARTLSTSLTPDASDVKLENAVTSTVQQLMRNRIPYGVVLSSISPQKNVGVGESNDIAKFAEPVPNTKVQSVRLNLRGTYKTYEGLVGYIGGLKELPAALVYLKVDVNTFELGIRVYGN